MRTAPYVCGTTRAYFHHHMVDERPDEACLAAHRMYTRRLRKRRQVRAEEIMGRPVPHREVPHVLGNYGP